MAFHFLSLPPMANHVSLYSCCCCTHSAGHFGRVSSFSFLLQSDQVISLSPVKSGWKMMLLLLLLGNDETRKMPFRLVARSRLEKRRGGSAMCDAERAAFDAGPPRRAAVSAAVLLWSTESERSTPYKCRDCTWPTTLFFFFLFFL